MSQAKTKLRSIGQQKTKMSLDNTARPSRPGAMSWFRRATRCASARLTCWWSAMGCFRCQPR